MTQKRRPKIATTFYGRSEGYNRWTGWDPFSDKLPHEQHSSTFKADARAREARREEQPKVKGRARFL